MQTVSSSPSPVKRLPGPRGLPLLGVIPQIARHGMPEILRRSFEQYGDVLSLPVGGRQWILFAHPDHVRHALVEARDKYVKGPTYDDWRVFAGLGLVSSEGDFWKRQRRLAAPAFHHQQIAAIGDLIVRATADMLTAWDEDGEGRFDLHEEMIRLTLRIVGEALFAQDLSRTSDESTEAFAVALKMIMDRGNSAVKLPLWLPLPSNAQLKRALATLDRLVYAIIDNHRKEPREGTLLATFLGTVDEETGERMTDKQVRDEVVTMFVAGHETTALALTWTWHLLGQHPAVLARMEQELEAVLGGRPPTMQDYPELRYTRMVLEESLRLIPPVWTIARDVAEDDVVGGHRIPKGSTVLLSQWVTHRREDFWPDPERFDPDRFLPEPTKARHRYAYFPFSAGPRTCIGNQFSLVEGVLVLAAVCQRYRLAPIPGHVVVPDVQVTYRPTGGLPMTRTKRVSGA